MRFQLSLVTSAADGVDGRLYTLEFSDDRLTIIDNGKRKTLCRVAIGMVGIQSEGPFLHSRKNSNGQVLCSENKAIQTILYSDILQITLVCNLKRCPLITFQLLSGMERRFAITPEQCGEAERFLVRLDSISFKVVAC